MLSFILASISSTPEGESIKSIVLNKEVCRWPLSEMKLCYWFANEWTGPVVLDVDPRSRPTPSQAALACRPRPTPWLDSQSPGKFSLPHCSASSWAVKVVLREEAGARAWPLSCQELTRSSAMREDETAGPHCVPRT